MACAEVLWHDHVSDKRDISVQLDISLALFFRSLGLCRPWMPAALLNNLLHAATDFGAHRHGDSEYTGAHVACLIKCVQRHCDSAAHSARAHDHVAVYIFECDRGGCLPPCWVSVEGFVAMMPEDRANYVSK